MPGQAIKNSFYHLINKNETPAIKTCENCLKRCSHKYCLMKALINSCQGGDPKKAIFFAGEKAYKVNAILPVKEIFENLYKEIVETLEKHNT